MCQCKYLMFAVIWVAWHTSILVVIRIFLVWDLLSPEACKGRCSARRNAVGHQISGSWQFGAARSENWGPALSVGIPSHFRCVWTAQDVSVIATFVSWSLVWGSGFPFLHFLSLPQKKTTCWSCFWNPWPLSKTYSPHWGERTIWEYWCICF